MGIFQGDIILQQLISEGIEDIRKNPWLIDDIFSSLVTTSEDITSKHSKEIDLIKEWFLNNKIEVNLRYRRDKEAFPSITIALGSSQELDDMKSLGDLSHEVVKLIPSEIGKPVSYIVKPFVPESYDQSTGLLSVPDTVDLRGITAGQVLVDPDTGNGYVIQDIDSEGVYLEPELSLTLNRAGIVPQFPYYRARVERTFHQESYSIGIHVHGDPYTLLWLSSIVLYLIYRYRESLLEGRGFLQSSVSVSDMNQNPAFGDAEQVFSRYVSLSGMVKQSWLKTPYRVIEAIEMTQKTEEGYSGGIKILSNLDSVDSLDTENDLWTTKEDE